MKHQLEQAILLATKTEFQQIQRSKNRLEGCRITNSRIHLRYRQIDYILTTNSNAHAQISASLWRDDIGVWNRNLRLDDQNVFNVIACKSHRAATHDSGVVMRLNKLRSRVNSQLHELQSWFVESKATVFQSRICRETVETTIQVGNPKLRLLGLKNASIKIEVPLNGRERFHSDIPVRLMVLNNRGSESLVEEFDCPIEKYCRWFDRRFSRDLNSLTNPIESIRYSPEIRQALLVIVPLRLAEFAKESGQVDWYRELNSSCLEFLHAQPDSPQRVIRELFFQLLLVRLTNLRSETPAMTQYRQLGKGLAKMRSSNPELPYNPVLCYQCWSRSQEDIVNRIPDDVQRELKWYIQEAALEQTVEAMELL